MIVAWHPVLMLHTCSLAAGEGVLAILSASRANGYSGGRLLPAGVQSVGGSVPAAQAGGCECGGADRYGRRYRRRAGESSKSSLKCLMLCTGCNTSCSLAQAYGTSSSHLNQPHQRSHR